MNQGPQGSKANQRPQGLQVDKAITGFLQYKSAEGLAPVTVDGNWLHHENLFCHNVTHRDILR
jgi:hypothetical protein